MKACNAAKEETDEAGRQRWEKNSKKEEEGDDEFKVEA